MKLFKLLILTEIIIATVTFFVSFFTNQPLLFQLVVLCLVTINLFGTIYYTSK